MRSLVEAPNGLLVSNLYLQAKLGCKGGNFVATEPPAYIVSYLPNTPPTFPGILVEGKYADQEGTPGAGTPSEFTYLGTDSEVEVFIAPGTEVTDGEAPSWLAPATGPSEGAAFNQTYYVPDEPGTEFRPTLTFGAVSKTGPLLATYDVTLFIKELTRGDAPARKFTVINNPDYDPVENPDLYLLVEVLEDGSETAGYPIPAGNGFQCQISLTDVTQFWGFPPTPDERVIEVELVVQHKTDFTKAVAPKIRLEYQTPQTTNIGSVHFQGDHWLRQGDVAYNGRQYVVNVEGNEFRTNPQDYPCPSGTRQGWAFPAGTPLLINTVGGTVADLRFKGAPLPVEQDPAEVYDRSAPAKFGFSVRISGESVGVEALRQNLYLTITNDGPDYEPFEVQSDLQPMAQGPAGEEKAYEFAPGSADVTIAGPNIVGASEYGCEIRIKSKVAELDIAGLSICIDSWAIMDTPVPTAVE